MQEDSSGGFLGPKLPRQDSIYKPRRWIQALSLKYLSFGFISPYMKLKDTELMKEEDLPEIPIKDDPFRLGRHLENALRVEERKALLSKREPSLMRALVRAYYPFIIVCVISLTVIDIIRFSVGLIIKSIVSDLQKPMPLSEKDRMSSIVNFLMVFGIMFFSAISIPHIVFFQYRFIFRIYASLATNILWRGLKKSGGLLVRKSIEKNDLLPPGSLDVDMVGRKVSGVKKRRGRDWLRRLFVPSCFKNKFPPHSATPSVTEMTGKSKTAGSPEKGTKLEGISNEDSMKTANLKETASLGIGEERLGHQSYAIRLNYINIYNVMMGDLFPCSILIGNLISVILFPLRVFLASIAISRILRSSLPAKDGNLTWIINISLTSCILTLTIFISTSAFFQVKSGFLRKPLFFAKDCRLDELRYVLSNIRTIKLLNWESFVYKNLVEIRAHEIYWRGRRLWLSGFSEIFSFCSSYISQTVLFTSLGLLFKTYYGKFSIPATATVPIIFSLTTLFASVSMLPEELGYVVQGFVSLGRIETFLFSRIYDHPLLQDEKEVSRKKAPRQKSKVIQGTDELEESGMNQVIETCFPNVSLWYANTTFARQVYDDPIYRYLHQLGYLRSCGGFDLLIRQRERLRRGESLVLDFTQKELQALPQESQMVANLSTLTEIASFDKKGSFDKENVNKILRHFEYAQHARKSLNFEIGEAISDFKMLGKLGPCLVDLNIRLSYGEICFIVGDHGSGKSTFIDSLLGELFRIRGDSYIGNAERNVDIVNSNPWIPFGTFKDVILAGREYFPEVMELVTRVCQLHTDLQMWQLGYDHLIEEYGNNLSNGQKARVSLARSIYWCPPSEKDQRSLQKRIICMDSIFEHMDPNVTINILSLLFSKDAFGAGFNTSPDPGLLDQVIPSRRPRDYTILITLNESTLAYIMRENVFNPEFGLRFFRISEKSLREFSHLEVVRPGEAPPSPKDVSQSRSPVDFPGDPAPSAVSRAPMEASATRERLSRSSSCSSASSHPNSGRSSINTPKVSFGENGLLRAIEIETSKIVSRSSTSAEPPDSNLENWNKPFKFDENFLELSGHVKLESYSWYLFGFFGKRNFVSLVILFVLLALTVSSIDVIIILWSGSDLDMRREMILRKKLDHAAISALGFKYMAVFIGVTLFAFLIKFITTCIEISSVLKSAIVLHNKILLETIASPLTFFDSIDSQSLVNIFSMDLGIIDGELNLSILPKFFSFLTSQCFIFWSSPVCVVLYPLFIWYYFVYIFKPTRIQTRESYRFLINTYGPLCNKTECSIRGSSTIRNMGFSEHYKRDVSRVLHTLQKTFYYSYSIGIWRLIRTLFFGILLMFLLFICPTVSRILNLQLPLWITRFAHGFQSAMISSFLVLSLSLIISLPNTITTLITNFIDLEKNMCSVQRFQILEKQINQAIRIEEGKSQSSIGLFSEELSLAGTAEGASLSPQAWDSQSPGMRRGLLVKDIVMSYNNNNVVLDRLFMHILPGEHIGLIGRTGSGKSSLFQCILGHYKLDRGFISLDGLNIEQDRSLGVEDDNSPPNFRSSPMERYFRTLPRQQSSHSVFENLLREISANNAKRTRAIGYIPQNCIFIKNWRVRDYIDPFREYEDSEIWRAIRDLSFEPLFHNLPNGLDSVVYSDSYSNNIPQVSEKSKVKINCKSLDHLNHSYLFSLSQLRLVTFLRIYLNSSKYKLLLVDEPPILVNKDLQEKRGGGGSREEDEGAPSRSSDRRINIRISKDSMFNDKRQINIRFKNSLDLEVCNHGAENGQAEKEKDGLERIPSISYLINKHFRHCIAIIIAHHSESIEFCDKVYVMGKGKIENIIDLREGEGSQGGLRKGPEGGLDHIFKLIES
ncbi:ABC transporter [Cryptosporidium felis]|nr:ABC transporter [Cryptosporidium felis]